MELDQPTPVSCPPSLDWCQRTVQHTRKVPSALNQLSLQVYASRLTGTIQGKEGSIQVLAGLAPSSQTVGSLFRVIEEQMQT
jgi:hypothetical protein